MRERILKYLAVFQLHGESPLAVGFGCFPLIDGGRNRDALVDELLGSAIVIERRLHSGGIELPLGDEAVGRQPTLQSR